MSFLWLVFATLVRTPYADVYALIAQVFELHDGFRGLPAYLWTPHAGHHVPFARALMLFDMDVLKGTGWPTVIAAFAATLATAAVFAREGWRAAIPAPALRIPATMLAAMAALTAAAAFDVSQPVFNSYPMALVFAVAAVSLFASASPAARIAGLACAASAAFGNAVGLAAWASLAWIAWRGERRWLWLAIVLGVGGVFSAIYLHGHGADLTAQAAAVGGAVRFGFLLDFLGLPLSQSSTRLGMAAGATLLVASLVLVALTRQEEGRSVEVGRGLILFSLLAAFLASAGRVDPALGVIAPVRYAPLTTPLHVGLMILALPILGAWRPTRALGAMAVAAAALLTAQLMMARNDLVTVGVIRATLADWKAGGRTPLMRALIYPDFPAAEGVDARLRQEGRFQ